MVRNDRKKKDIIIILDGILSLKGHTGMDFIAVNGQEKMIRL